MPRKTVKLCADCHADLNAPSVTPSNRSVGFCITCRPDHTTHLKLSGDHVTFCGKPTWLINEDPAADVKAHEPLFGSNHVNCAECMRVLARR